MQIFSYFCVINSNMYHLNNMIMKKILYLLTVLAPLLFTACDEHDNYYDSWRNNGSYGNSLNSYEETLVGNYVSTNGGTIVNYLTLNRNHTGVLKVDDNGTVASYNFQWEANSSKIAFHYGGDDSETLAYRFSNNQLIIGEVIYVQDNGQQNTTQAGFIGQWQGKIPQLYKDRWNNTGDSLTTVWIFNSSTNGTGGEGLEVDYNDKNMYTDFAYLPFTWSLVNSVITITYQAGVNFMPLHLSKYAIDNGYFNGTMYDGTSTYLFSFNAISNFDWSKFNTRSTRSRMMAAGKNAVAAIVQPSAGALQSVARWSATPVLGGSFSK